MTTKVYEGLLATESLLVKTKAMHHVQKIRRSCCVRRRVFRQCCLRGVVPV